ncbi:hypothetical protein KC340_g3581 [Hortaea werneckii]|nr:hypothetical protein KC339_g5151 [Hortaea werneckii]KAI7244050.1 hypothetical protein KC365_g1766 [Hortaea werneckii]KAI7331941.1 hypothetical protein KC340_g3581 [Hortaea werneckii]
MADAAFDAWTLVEVPLRREKGLLWGADVEINLAQVLREVVWPTLSDEFKAKIQEHQEAYSKAKGAQGAARETCARFKQFLDKVPGGIAGYDFSVEDESDRYDENGKRKVTLHVYVEQWRRLIEARRAFLVATADLRDLLERYVEDIDPPDARIIGNMSWSQKQLHDMHEEETKLKKADEGELNNVLLPRLEFGEQRAAERLERRRQDLGVSKQWIGGWQLGEGSFGSAAIWVKQDSQGRIVDRIAVKDTIYAEWMWDRTTDFWAIDPSEPKDKRRRRNEQPAKAPTEAVAMLRLRSRVGAPECVVRIRNWRLQSEKRMYRLLMEFCPYGDLADLVLNSDYSRARQQLDEQGHGKDHLPLWVPEPFIWSVFESLATAGLLMEKGELEAHPGEPHWWEEIIHRDFKLANIFLGENLESRYRGYPSTKLGDFGLSLILRKDDDRPNDRFSSVGTRGARAPEQAYTSYARPSAAANVWGIGIIIWSLISLEETDENLGWDDEILQKRTGGVGPEFDAIWARQKVPEIDKNAEKFYSKELVGLMRECLRFEPDTRISFLRLRRRILKHTQDGRLTNNLRSAEKDDDGFCRDIRFKASKWPLNGLAHDVRGIPKGFGGMHKLPVPSSNGDSSDDDDLGGPRGAEITVRGSQSAAQRALESHENQAVAGEEAVEGGERRTAGERAEGEDVNDNDGAQANEQPEGTVPGRPPRIRLRGPRAPEPPPPPPGLRSRVASDRPSPAAEPPSPPPDPRLRVGGDRSPSAAEPPSPPPDPRLRVAGGRPPQAAEPLPPPPRPRSRVAGDRRPRAAEPPSPPPGLQPRLGRRREGRGAQDGAAAAAVASPPPAVPTASTTALAIAALDAFTVTRQQPRNENENEDAAPPAPPTRPSRVAQRPSNEDENEASAPPAPPRPSHATQYPPTEDEDEGAAPAPAPPPPQPRRPRAANRGRNAAAPTAPARGRGRAAGITRAAAAPTATARGTGRAAGITRAAAAAAVAAPVENEEEGGEGGEGEDDGEGEAAPRKGRGKGRVGTRGAGKRKRDDAEAEAEEEEEEEQDEEEVEERPRRRRRRGRGK